jgi:hypothetical protein
MFTVKNWQSIAMPQDNSTTCWLTCYKMLFKWRGINPEGLDNILEGIGLKKFTDEDTGTFQKGLMLKDYVTANSTLGLQSLQGGEFNQDALEYMLEKKGPIWCTMLFGNYNHNVVVIGAGEEQVQYINPWWDIEKKYRLVTSKLSDFNKTLKRFNGWKGANACWP